jgi:hypothetical protein
MSKHDREQPSGSDTMLVDALSGAVAGAVGVWVMDRVDWAMYRAESPQARQRTKRVRPGGLDPAHVLVNRVAGAFGTTLSPPQPHPAGIAVHYSLGIGPGALYGAFHDRAPVLGVGRGALFGLGLFLVQDEVVNAATGLSARPGQYPWQAHARGLVAHLVYGLVTDSVLRLLKGLTQPSRQHQSPRTQPSRSRSPAPGARQTL